MNIPDSAPLATTTRVILDESEQFDFTPQFGSKARVYRARRVTIQWRLSDSTWEALEVIWNGPLVTKKGLSEAVWGEDRHNTRWSSREPDYPDAAIPAAVTFAARTLPKVTR